MLLLIKLLLLHSWTGKTFGKVSVSFMSVMELLVDFLESQDDRVAIAL